MKILHVIPSVSSVHGGPSEAMKLFEQACVISGINIETATTDDDGPGRRKQNLVLGSAIESAGVIRYYFGKTTDTYKISLSMLRWLWRNIKNYDVVHIHALFSFSSTAAAWIARYRKVPYIIRPLGTMNKYGLENRRPLSKRLSMWLVENSILKNAACVHCTSSNEQAELHQLGAALETTVLPLAASVIPMVDKTLIATKFPTLENKRWLIFMSRLDPVKNIESLLQAFKVSLVNMPQDVVLLMAGDGDVHYKQSLLVLAAELEISERVIWAGHLQGDIKASALRGAELFLLPSRSENFGIAAAEAMLIGLPCVLSKGVAIAEAAANEGAVSIIDSDDVVGMAANILQLVNDDQLRKQISQNAASFANARYSVEIMGNNLKKLYNDVLAQSGGARATA
ncbi:MAG: glycosyltransferase [Arenimonas sp.]